MNKRLLQLLLCLLGLFAYVQGINAEGEEKHKAMIVATDCNKCHESIVFSLGINGEGHRTLCLECHQGHPPADVDIIPSCSHCHTGDVHYDLAGCLRCHTNPHTPLEIKLSHDITDACLSCHDSQIAQLLANPSIHTKLACTACHNYHGQIQPCGNCHLPHSDTMGEESCGECHKAHMPLVVNYGEGIPSEDCGSCHVEVYKNMVRNSSRHRDIACVFCHSEKHGIIPACEKCHGRPHPEVMLARFEHCMECHGSAHDLMTTSRATSIFARGRE